ncbi:MAG: trehalose-phosphatase, partial [Dehalococcoidales bacterium]|nr:trehalose-phosphatase [Dehalococcoidales bacterium]
GTAFSVGIISGRPLSEIKTMVGIERIYYVGNHGLEIGGPRLISLSAKIIGDRITRIELVA